MMAKQYVYFGLQIVLLVNDSCDISLMQLILYLVIDTIQLM